MTLIANCDAEIGSVCYLLFEIRTGSFVEGYLGKGTMVEELLKRNEERSNNGG